MTQDNNTLPSWLKTATNASYITASLGIVLFVGGLLLSSEASTLSWVGELIFYIGVGGVLLFSMYLRYKHINSPLNEHQKLLPVWLQPLLTTLYILAAIDIVSSLISLVSSTKLPFLGNTGIGLAAFFLIWLLEKEKNYHLIKANEQADLHSSQ